MRITEVPDIRLNKVAGDLWRHSEKVAITNYGESFNFAVVFSGEFQMRNKGSKILPARKGFCIDQHSMQLVIGFDVWIDFLRDILKIPSFEY